MEPIVRDGYKINVEVEENKAFLQLHIDELNFSLIRELKTHIDEVANAVRQSGHDILFAHTNNNKIVRFWERILPFDDLVQVSDSDWVCCWYLEEN